MHCDSSIDKPTLDVNDLGAFEFRYRLSDGSYEYTDLSEPLLQQFCVYSIFYSYGSWYISEYLSMAHVQNVMVNGSGNNSVQFKNSLASANYSFSEGFSTKASGNFSHSEGYYTHAMSNCQHVQGKHNVTDNTNTYAHIVGNGTGVNAERVSNAHTLDWDGNAWFSGDVYVGSTSGKNRDEGSKKLATEEYVDAKEFDSIILKSENKKFRLTINDEGVLSATEITE
jgi:hypothetical protein